MFVRVKRSGSGREKHEYLQIVESRREGAAVRQKVIATLGRKDELVADGRLDAVVRSLAKYSTTLQVAEKVRREGLHARTARSWGPALVFERLWQQQGLPELLHRLAVDRHFEFDVERTCFALALQRLCEAEHGSDLQGASWLRTVECPGFSEIALQHLYRTVGGFLYDVRETLEWELFQRDRDLFSDELDLVFIDTTSTFIWRDEETGLRRRGHSKDRRPDQPQVLVCVAVDAHSWPIGWDILPGNTGDGKAFVAMIERLRKRFRIRRVTVVADRGMIAAKTIELLTTHRTAPYDYILGCRMRRQKEVKEAVLARAGRYQPLEGNLEVKEVRVGERRYVVCRNPIEQKKDELARQAILEKLTHTLEHDGPKAVIGNKGFARFLKVSRGAVTINEKAVEADARLDGKFVLRTSTSLSPEEVARAYKSLWRVERTFRETKSTLEVRPIFHHRDETTIGHIVACFLALRLEVDLQRRLDERGCTVSWPELMRDLAQVQAVDLELDGERYRLRTDLSGSAFQAFAAAGKRPPAVVTHLGPAPPAVSAPAQPDAEM
jgi:Transposase DDE domain